MFNNNNQQVNNFTTDDSEQTEPFALMPYQCPISPQNQPYQFNGIAGQSRMQIPLNPNQNVGYKVNFLHNFLRIIIND